MIGLTGHGAQLWQSWLLGVSPRLTGTPWKVAAGDLAINDLETSLGTYPLHNESAWCPDCRTTAWNPSHILTKRLLERGVFHVPLLVCLMTCVGDMRWGHVQDLDGRLYGSSHFSLHLWTPAKLSKVLNIEVSLLLSRLSLVYMLGLVTSMYSGRLRGCLVRVSLPCHGW